jgi:hypothetical protein
MNRQKNLLPNIPPCGLGQAGAAAPALDERTVQIDQFPPGIGRARTQPDRQAQTAGTILGLIDRRHVRQSI